MTVLHHPRFHVLHAYIQLFERSLWTTTRSNRPIYSALGVDRYELYASAVYLDTSISTDPGPDIADTCTYFHLLQHNTCLRSHR